MISILDIITMFSFFIILQIYGGSLCEFLTNYAKGFSLLCDLCVMTHFSVICRFHIFGITWTWYDELENQKQLSLCFACVVVSDLYQPLWLCKLHKLLLTCQRGCWTYLPLRHYEYWTFKRNLCSSVGLVESELNLHYEGLEHQILPLTLWCRPCN